MSLSTSRSQREICVVDTNIAQPLVKISVQEHWSCALTPLDWHGVGDKSSLLAQDHDRGCFILWLKSASRALQKPAWNVPVIPWWAALLLAAADLSVQGTSLHLASPLHFVKHSWWLKKKRKPLAITCNIAMCPGQLVMFWNSSKALPGRSKMQMRVEMQSLGSMSNLSAHLYRFDRNLLNWRN